MLQVGAIYTLWVQSKEAQEYILNDELNTTVSLPINNTKNEYEIGDKVNVFIQYRDDGNIEATAILPEVTIGKFAYLKVLEASREGAYLDWGMPDALFVPDEEQEFLMEEGFFEWIYLKNDELNLRLIGSSRLDDHLSNEELTVKAGEEVEALVLKQTDLGFNVIVNHQHRGLIFTSDIFQEIYPGDVLTAYIKTVREDQKLDVVIQKQGFTSIEPNAQKILNHLKTQGGSSNLTDKSPPELIYETLQMSKKNFKKGLGWLYKNKKVVLEKESTKLT